MDELISRKTLIKRFKKKKEQAPTLRDAFYLDCVMAVIDTAPAIESEPVRHGRWMDRPEIKSFKHTNIPVVECSKCGIIFCDIINNHGHREKINDKSNYCPNCGAKMDLEAREDET